MLTPLLERCNILFIAIREVNHMLQAVAFSHHLLKNYVYPGARALDATVGNGHDCVVLASLVGPSGKVYGFDIQAQAIERTQQRLADHQLEDRVDLFHLGHQDMTQVLDPAVRLQAVIFNLGYLPTADKSIITQGPTTVQAIEASLTYLNEGGLVVVVVYAGHEGGEEEKDQVLAYVSQLDQTAFDVIQYRSLNQKNTPPFVIAIEKR